MKAAVEEGKREKARIDAAKAVEAAKARRVLERIAKERRAEDMERAKAWLNDELPGHIRAAAADGKSGLEIDSCYNAQPNDLPRVIVCKAAGLDVSVRCEDTHDMDTGHVDGQRWAAWVIW